MHHMIQWNPLHNNYVLSPRPSEDTPLIRTYFGGQSPDSKGVRIRKVSTLHRPPTIQRLVYDVSCENAEM